VRERYVSLRADRFMRTETRSRKHKDLSGAGGSRNGPPVLNPPPTIGSSYETRLITVSMPSPSIITSTAYSNISSEWTATYRSPTTSRSTSSARGTKCSWRTISSTRTPARSTPATCMERGTSMCSGGTV